MTLFLGKDDLDILLEDINAIERQYSRVRAYVQDTDEDCNEVSLDDLTNISANIEEIQDILNAFLRRWKRHEGKKHKS